MEGEGQNGKRGKMYAILEGGGKWKGKMGNDKKLEGTPLGKMEGTSFISRPI